MLEDWKNNKDYFRMLELIGKLSNLFSESKISYIHYRLTENIFCKYFNASNLSRSEICQDDDKALMSNPNSALGKWLLRDLMKIKPSTLVTMNDLNRLGFNSLLITKIDDDNYRLSVRYSKSYASFTQE